MAERKSASIRPRAISQQLQVSISDRKMTWRSLSGGVAAEKRPLHNRTKRGETPQTSCKNVHFSLSRSQDRSSISRPSVRKNPTTSSGRPSSNWSRFTSLRDIHGGERTAISRGADNIRAGASRQQSTGKEECGACASTKPVAKEAACLNDVPSSVGCVSLFFPLRSCGG